MAFPTREVTTGLIDGEVVFKAREMDGNNKAMYFVIFGRNSLTIFMHLFYLSLPFRTISTISCVVIFALIDGTSKGEEAIFSGTNAKVRPSFLRISTLPVFSACSRTIASFCRASEYV
jgi:hypothetical protein